MIKWDEWSKLLLSHPHPAYGRGVTGGLDHALKISCLAGSCESVPTDDIATDTSCSSTRVQASPILPARAVLPTRCTYLRISTGAS